MMIDETAVDLIEKCARLHIFASHRLCELDFNDFDQRMNTGTTSASISFAMRGFARFAENLTKCLQSLRHLYEDLSRKGIVCANEPEFRAYDVMLNLNDSNILRCVA